MRRLIQFLSETESIIHEIFERHRSRDVIEGVSCLDTHKQTEHKTQTTPLHMCLRDICLRKEGSTCNQPSIYLSNRCSVCLSTYLPIYVSSLSIFWWSFSQRRDDSQGDKAQYSRSLRAVREKRRRRRNEASAWRELATGNRARGEETPREWWDW